jgi:cysteine desulfurase
MWWRKKSIYLDFAAATPVLSSVKRAMKPYLSEIFGNPSAIHKGGVEAKKAVEAAREEVARTLRVRASDVTFTGSGTESNNLALFGTVEALLDSRIPYSDIEIISTKIEHPSIKKVLERLENRGVIVSYAPIDEEGLIVEKEFVSLLSPKTRLVTFAFANSETGVVQDIGRLARHVKDFERQNNLTIYFHTDASQAPLWLPCALDALNVDMMTLDAGKCGGPKGVGLLIHRGKVKLVPIILGGSQEDGLRAGTENVAGIVGAAKAIKLAQDSWQKRSDAISALRDRFLRDLLTTPGVVLNGSLKSRLPNNVDISIPGIDSEFAVVTLDTNGIFASTKSACSGKGGGGSEVIYEMTKDEERAKSTLRFSLGENTTYKDLQKTVLVLKTHVEKMSNFS